MTASSRIRERIKRLREMTSDRGCTEAEALSAAAKAAQLMRDHGLSEADIVMDEKASKSRHKSKSQKARLWPTIAHCTNTAVIVLEGSDGVEVAFIGRDPGPEIAVYLRAVCERAVDTAIVQFKTEPQYRRKRKLAVKRDMVAAFTTGMVARLNRRLVKLFEPTVSAESRALAAAARDERYPGNAVAQKPKAELRHHQAAISGWLAGDKVTLAHGMSGSDAPLQIGGSA